MKSMAGARLKRVRALELVAEGKSYDEVAREVGFSHRGSAHRAVFKALAEREVEDVDLLRALELARLDKLQASLWDAALAGDHRAVASALRIIDQRVRLLGLERKADGRSSTDLAILGARTKRLKATQGGQRESGRA